MAVLNIAGVAIVSVACIASAITDLRTRTIPNWVSFGLAAIAFAFALLHGWPSLAVCAAVYAVVFALGLAMFALRVLGGGDVKLLAAVAASLGFPDAMPFLAYTGIAGGVLAFAWSFIDRKAKLPYAVAILAGFAVLIAGKLWVPNLRLL